jgi:trans-aconitate 2-methyltransferase
MNSSLAQYAKQYVTFEDERTRPVRNLVAAIPNTQVHTAIDIGCGPGNSTEVLGKRYPDAAIRGLDSSSDMVEAARKRLPQFQFTLADAQTWEEAGPFDVILANASLQWTRDHHILFPRLVSKLSEGGSLAVQMPDNMDDPAHRLIRDVAAEAPWADKLANVKRTPRESPTWYYELLRPHCTRVDVWRTVYYHPLAGGVAAIVEWFKGSALRPYLEPLSETERADFLTRYERAVAATHPPMIDGSVMLPFPRVFMVATR